VPNFFRLLAWTAVTGRALAGQDKIAPNDDALDPDTPVDIIVPLRADRSGGTQSAWGTATNVNCEFG
jgi:hypothetical protein